MEERRRSVRQNCRLRGRIFFSDGRKSEPCSIRDISYEGARIDLLDQHRPWCDHAHHCRADFLISSRAPDYDTTLIEPLSTAWPAGWTLMFRRTEEKATPSQQKPTGSKPIPGRKAHGRSRISSARRKPTIFDAVSRASDALTLAGRHSVTAGESCDGSTVADVCDIAWL